MSKVSVREAALLVGKSRETINTACNDGLLSCGQNSRGHKEIDVSELARVYPLVMTMDELRPSEPVRPSPNLTAGPSGLSEQLAVLRERLEGITQERDLLKAERVREREQLEAEIEHLRSSLEKSQEHHGKAMLLLTSQQREEGAPLDQPKISALEESVEKLRRQNRKIVHVLQQERSRTFWQRLFG